MSLQAENISFGFRRDRLILKDVNALARGGRVTALIGPNAAGKTTLLRVLAGVLKPQVGRVLLDGKSIDALGARERAARIAYVAQRSTVNAPFRVRDVLELGGFWRGAAGSGSIEHAIGRCELGELVDAFFHELSVGQQQRVALGRMLVQMEGGIENAVVLLDEPMSALDPRHIEKTGVLLRELASKGAAVVVVLHDLTLAGMLADDVWAINGGEMVASGAMTETLDERMLEGIYGSEFHLRKIAAEAGSTVIVEPRYDFGVQSSGGDD